MTRIEIDGRVWIGEDLPEHVKLEDVRKAIGVNHKDRRLGDKVFLRVPPVFKPSDNLFEGIIGLDRNWLPIRKPEPTMQFTWTETIQLGTPRTAE